LRNHNRCLLLSSRRLNFLDIKLAHFDGKPAFDFSVSIPLIVFVTELKFGKVGIRIHILMEHGVVNSKIKMVRSCGRMYCY
jgi:hypothetical protein